MNTWYNNIKKSKEFSIKELRQIIGKIPEDIIFECFNNKDLKWKNPQVVYYSEENGKKIIRMY